jgi:hypothetical protein
MNALFIIVSVFFRISFFCFIFQDVHAQVDDGEYIDPDLSAVNEDSQPEQDLAEKKESSEQNENESVPAERFVPREEISQDFGVSFPVDI